MIRDQVAKRMEGKAEIMAMTVELMYKLKISLKRTQSQRWPLKWARVAKRRQRGPNFDDKLQKLYFWRASKRIMHVWHRITQV